MNSHTNVKKNLLIESQYLAPIVYWQTLQQYEQIFIEQYEHFVKASYRNRCYIVTPNGLLLLSVPILHGRNKRRAAKDVMISYEHKWQKNHWDSIATAYRRSPYFEYYEDEFYPFYHTKKKYLLDFYEKQFNWIAEQLQFDLNIKRTEAFEYTPNEDTEDLRSAIHPNPKKDRITKSMTLPTYHQVFEEKIGFFPNVSIIDLLFAEGPNASTVLSNLMDEKE